MSDVHRLHRESFVVDAHCDTALRLAAGDSLTPGAAPPRGTWICRGCGPAAWTCRCSRFWVDTDSRKRRPAAALPELLDAVVAETERLRDDFRLVLSARDMDDAAQAGQIGVLLSIEDGAALEGSLSALRAFYRLGVRAMGLTWNGRNELGEGVGAAKGAGGGLTAFGRDVVREMNRLGMIVDVSHLSEAGFWDVLEISDAPVIASHSNAKAVCDHRRNLTDRQIKALADAGGVMGINFCPPFLADGGRVPWRTSCGT